MNRDSAEDDRHFLTIGEFARSRDNNFNLIRFLAAISVLLSHSYALSIGDPSSEPLRSVLGLSMGDIAVDVFFLTSGFLVTGSLVLRGSIRSFAIARALRIYPALGVSVAVTVVAVGGWFSSRDFSSFISSSVTWRYILKNSSLVLGIAYELPGAFEHNPFRVAVNGSLWSLPYEIAMYALIAILWVTARASTKNAMGFALLVAIVSLSGFAGALGLPLTHHVSLLAWHLTAMFFAGGCLNLFGRRVRLDPRLFLLLVLALAAGRGTTIFAAIYLVAIPYLVLYLAYVPAGWPRLFNRVGDYSYGIYIYAFPVQQMLAETVPGIDPMTMMLASLPVTVLLAIASWHLVESRALALKMTAFANGPKR